MDLNDYVVPGVYTVFNAADSATIQNVPPSLSGGKLVVENLGAASTAQQTWYSHSVSAAIYRRYGSSVTKEWNPWVRVLTDHFNSYSQTKNGFTTTVFVIQPRFVSLRIRGKNSNSLTTYGATIDIGTFDIFKNLFSSSIIKYTVSGRYAIQINISSSGAVSIGNTRSLINGAAESLPSDHNIWIEEVLMIR